MPLLTSEDIGRERALAVAFEPGVLTTVRASHGIVHKSTISKFTSRHAVSKTHYKFIVTVHIVTAVMVFLKWRMPHTDLIHTCNTCENAGHKIHVANHTIELIKLTEGGVHVYFIKCHQRTISNRTRRGS